MANISALHQQYLDNECRRATSEAMAEADLQTTVVPTSFSVGVIGGGMAGLYSALLLQNYIPEAKITIFEARGRVGGNVYTHHFSSEPYQYFEAGAMRLPVSDSYRPVFQLIDFLNKELPDQPLKLIEFFNSCPTGNRVFVNNTKQQDGRVMSGEYANMHCSELGFPSEAKIGDDDEASKLLSEALTPVVAELQDDFVKALKKYNDMSLYDYLSKERKWNLQKISYVELMLGPCNSFRRGLVDSVLWRILILKDVTSWKTIAGGMSKFPQACAEAVKLKGGDIWCGASVKSIVQTKDAQSIQVGFTQPKNDRLKYQKFDALIVAIPPPNICLIPERPRWGPDLEHALRALYFAPVSKMGLRFKTRFWERSDLQLPPSRGGCSMTDLPIRLVIYPDYGVGDKGIGVLYIYCKADDAKRWVLSSKVERIHLALKNLQLLYPEIDIAQEYAGGVEEESESFIQEAFTNDIAVGGITYLPGQFYSFYPVMVKPQGRVYFAGCHLSNPLWIIGALESARRVVQQVLTKERRENTVVKYI